MENRNGLAVNGCVNLAEGRAEPEAALAMVEEIAGEHRITLGGDKGYDRKEFVQELRDHQVTPHIACKQTSIIDKRTTRHPGYLISQQKRKRIEEIFGWVKTVGGLRKNRHRGLAQGRCPSPPQARNASQRLPGLAGRTVLKGQTTLQCQTADGGLSDSTCLSNSLAGTLATLTASSPCRSDKPATAAASRWDRGSDPRLHRRDDLSAWILGSMTGAGFRPSLRLLKR
jgi:hypothetical protein